MAQSNQPRAENYVPAGPKTKLETLVTDEDLRRMFDYFSKNVYRAQDRDPVAMEAMGTAIELMRHDYTLFTISNKAGELCSHYPTELVLLEYQNTLGNDTIYETLHDGAVLREKISNCNLARCRTRFPMPVILYKGKYVLRSATLSGAPELYSRAGLNYIMTWNNGQCESDGDVARKMEKMEKMEANRRRDIDLLRTFNVEIIIDLMVEKKKVKFGFNVSSSEKVDKENRYSEFQLLSLPYPGCEFFTQFHRENYEAGSLYFDWSQSFIDAEITPLTDPCIQRLGIQWTDYKSWDLITMTKNYLKVILKYLEDRDAGILIHCISGWDRTPLFISLVRMSLWADGLIHQHLSPRQMLYLTIAYDWMLFGHNLQDRTQKSEDILYFCFYMLKFISGDEFCFNHQKRKRLSSERSDRAAHRSFRNVSVEEPLMFEPDPNGSNVSLNSNSSSGSDKSQDQNADSEPLSPLPNLVEMASSPSPSIHSLSDEFVHISPQDVAGPMRSPSARRTSPQPIPRTSRLRHDSVTSTGSWQMISGTGSLNASDGCLNGNGNSDNGNQPDNAGLKNGKGENGNYDRAEESRASKLYAVRKLMFSLYSSVIGMSAN